VEVNLVKNHWSSVGPKYKLDKFGLPNTQPGVPQPKWVHNRGKIYWNLSVIKKETFCLWVDPFLEFDLCTYVLIYSHPNQVQNYPAIAQALPHIVQHPQSPGACLPTNSNFDFSTPSNFSLCKER
jgi:hypothetical protein